jgi:hypothetical protein
MNKRSRFSLIAFVVMSAALAAPLQASCTWYVADTTSVTTYGPLYGPNGQVIGTVPQYTTITLYWQADCTWDDPIYIPPPHQNPPPPYETQLYVQNVRVNTVDPEAPTITADVTSTHSTFPAAEVLLLIGGYRHDAVYPNANGTYTFAFPAIRNFGDGTTELAIEACDSASRCAMGTAHMVKSTPSALEASDTIHVWRYEGKSVVRAAYGHLFRQVYATTHFSVPESGENSRYQLKENSVQVAWNDPTPGVFFSAHAYGNTMNSSQISLGWCSWGDPVCYADHCRAECGYFGGYSLFAPYVDEWISSMHTENAEGWMITGGAALRVQAP